MTEAGPGDESTDEHQAADRALFGLDVRPDGTASFLLTPPLARHDGRLYGGTAIGVALALAEQVSGRRPLWTTVQYISGAAQVGDRIECRVDVLAAGRRTSQVRVTGWLGEEELFCALGSTAIGKVGAIGGVFRPFPAVPALDDCEEFQLPLPPVLRDAQRERPMEMRVARHRGERAEPGALRFWTRLPGHRATPAVLGYLADWVPMSVVHALGRIGGGTSLDNSLRLGAPADTDWVLMELEPHTAVGGYGHGAVHLWSPDGVLLGVGSQTTSLLMFD